MKRKLVHVDQLGFDEVFFVEGDWHSLTVKDVKSVSENVSSISLHMDLENAVLALLVETPTSPLFISTSKGLALSPSNSLSSAGKDRYHRRFSLSTSHIKPEAKQVAVQSNGTGMHYLVAEIKKTPLTIKERLKKQRLENHAQADANWASIQEKNQDDKTLDIPDYGMLCIWPEYPIDIGLPVDWADESLGHVGVLIISGKNRGKGVNKGSVRYFDFGRYQAQGISDPKYSYLGAVRRHFNTALQSLVVEFDDAQKPTTATMRPIIERITQLAGKNTLFNGFLKATTMPNAFDNMAAYARLRHDIHRDVQAYFRLNDKDALNQRRNEIVIEESDDFFQLSDREIEQKAKEQAEEKLLNAMKKKYPAYQDKVKYNLTPDLLPGTDQNTCLDFALDTLAMAQIDYFKGWIGIPSKTAWNNRNLFKTNGIIYEYASEENTFNVTDTL